MKFAVGLLALAATALAGGDWGHGGGGGGKGETVYTTVTVCPVTNTYTASGSTVYETSLTTSTIVVTAPCKDCAVTVPGPTVTEAVTKTIDVTYTTVCPVTETVTLPGTTKVNVYTTTSVVVTHIHSVVTATVDLPDVTSTQVATALTTITSLCPVTETKTISGDVVTVTYTTTSLVTTLLHPVVTATVDLPDVTATQVATALTTITSLCPVTETRTISGEVVTVTYTTTSLITTLLHTTDVEYTTVPTTRHVAVTKSLYTTLVTTEKVTHDVYTTVTKPVKVVTTIVKGETVLVTETNVQVVTLKTSYVVTDVIPVTETHEVQVTEAVTVTGPAATETHYQDVDVTVSGTKHETYTQIPTQTVVVPTSHAGGGAIPTSTSTPTPAPTPTPILPGAAHANNAPAAAFVPWITAPLPKDYCITSLQFTKHVYQDQYPSIDPTRPELSLAGKVAIITGASRGLGAKAYAPAFAKAGVRGLALLATNGQKLQAVKADINKLNPSVQVLAIPTDISNFKSVEAALDEIKSVFGHADILINNAAINTLGEGQLLAHEDPEAWWAMFEVNAKGTYLMSSAFIRRLPGPDTPATIINMVTSASWQTCPLYSGYALSKLVALQQIPYIAGGYPNITAVALHPGLFETEMLLDSFSYFSLEAPELAGGLAVWLSHPHAKFLSGRVLVGHWSVDELLERKDEISASNDLTLQLVGKFGAEHYA